MRNDNRPTYARAAGRRESGRIFRAIVAPLLLFLLCLFTVSNLAGYGTRIVTPLLGAMWALGAVAAWILPVHRQDILGRTERMCAIYCFTLLGLKIMQTILSGASTEMISASYEQPIPLAVGNALTGVVQTIFSLSTLMIPGGYLAMLIKQILQYRKTANLQKAFARARDIRDTGRSHQNRP